MRWLIQVGAMLVALGVWGRCCAGQETSGAAPPQETPRSSNKTAVVQPHEHPDGDAKPNSESAARDERPGPGRGRGMARGGGRGPDASMRADQEVFHDLLDHHGEIRRSVKKLENGVETLTESANPEVAGKIQEHVEAMHRRIKEGRGLRFWDDLFVALFQKSASIKMTVEKTKEGVRVVETSDDKFVVALIQAHAEVVSRFVAEGFDEAHRNHAVPAPVPARAAAAPAPAASSAAPAIPLEFPIIPKQGGVVRLPEAAEPPRAGAKVVLDVTADAKPQDVHKALDRIARLLNLYGAAGKSAADVKVAVVFHGDATRTVLSHEAYKKRHEIERNPNLDLIAELKKAGVEVFVCGQALHYKGIAKEEVAAGIPVAAAALTVVINKQVDGYAYLPMH